MGQTRYISASVFTVSISDVQKCDVHFGMLMADVNTLYICDHVKTHLIIISRLKKDGQNIYPSITIYIKLLIFSFHANDNIFRQHLILECEAH